MTSVKVHYDGKALILDELVSLPMNTPLVATIIEDCIVTPIEQKPKRVWGQFRGQMEMSPDFNDPLPDSFWLGDE